MKKSILNILIISIAIALQACAHHPMFYRGAEIRGQVIDAETKEPIEGVAVVAQWILYHEGIADGGHWKVLKVHEAVTDKNGNYSIPAWDPKRRPAMTHLDDHDPRISLFKIGYYNWELYNSDPQKFYKRYKPEEVDKWSFDKLRKRILATGSASEHNRSLRGSVWDGRTIELKKFVGSHRDLNYILSSVYSTVLNKEEEGVSLKKVKHTVKEYIETMKSLKPQPPIIYPHLEPNIEEFLKEESK